MSTHRSTYKGLFLISRYFIIKWIIKKILLFFFYYRKVRRDKESFAKFVQYMAVNN